MHDYEFELPWPPSINGYRGVFNGRQITSKRGRQYRDNAITAMRNLGLFNERISDRLSVSIVLNPPTLRRYDIDNFCKASFDALTHAGFWIDDEQVDVLTLNKGVKTKGGNIIVKVNKI